MFYKFYDIDTTLFLINIDRISHIYCDAFSSNLYHIVLIDDLVEDIEIVIDFEQYSEFEKVVSWNNR